MKHVACRVQSGERQGQRVNLLGQSCEFFAGDFHHFSLPLRRIARGGLPAIFLHPHTTSVPWRCVRFLVYSEQVCFFALCLRRTARVGRSRIPLQASLQEFTEHIQWGHSFTLSLLIHSLPSLLSLSRSLSPVTNTGRLEIVKETHTHTHTCGKHESAS